MPLLSDETKVPAGIAGFDDMTGGGIPRGRITVVLGGPGSGKTLFAMQSLCYGASQIAEPGIFVAFEERAADVLAHTSVFQWGQAARPGGGVTLIDAQLSHTVVTGGPFDLEGLLGMLHAKAQQAGAVRFVFDGIDVLLAHLADPSLVRRELFRLRDWLYSTGMTGIITAKADAVEGRIVGEYDFLQFMADCVVVLHHRVIEGTALRFLRIAKYRGCKHSSNEVPFTISSSGLELAIVGDAELNHPASREKVATGVARLDSMLGGGYFRGSSVLISGAPGTAKTSLASCFANAACARGERVLFISFDEAPDQIVRNVASIGIDLRQHQTSGSLRMASMRTMSLNAEAHVAHIRTLLAEHGAQHLVVDPLSALARSSGEVTADRTAIALLDFAKSHGVTVVSSSLLANALPLSEQTPIAVSTIADTWMHVSYVNQGGERNRALTIIKSRGMDHSNQVRELVLSASGVSLADVYSVGGEVLMGTLRWEKENEVRRAQVAAQQEAEIRERTAEFALAESKARGGALVHEQSLLEAELQRVREWRLAEEDRIRLLKLGVLERRGADAADQEEVAKP